MSTAARFLPFQQLTVAVAEDEDSEHGGRLELCTAQMCEYVPADSSPASLCPHEHEQRSSTHRDLRSVQIALKLDSSNRVEQLAHVQRRAQLTHARRVALSQEFHNVPHIGVHYLTSECHATGLTTASRSALTQEHIVRCARVFLAQLCWQDQRLSKLGGPDNKPVN